MTSHRLSRHHTCRHVVQMAAGLCVLLLSACSGGGSGSIGINGFTVKGKVVDEKLRPVPGIAIALNGQFDALIGRQTTNLAGEFEFSKVFDDRLVVFFDFPAEVPDRELAVEFKDDGNTAQIDVRLETDGDVDIDLLFIDAPLVVEEAGDDASSDENPDAGVDPVADDTKPDVEGETPVVPGATDPDAPVSSDGEGSAPVDPDPTTPSDGESVAEITAIDI